MNKLTRNQDREHCYHPNQKGSNQALIISLEMMEEKVETLLSFEPNSHEREVQPLGLMVSMDDDPTRCL